MWVPGAVNGARAPIRDTGGRVRCGAAAGHAGARGGLRWRVRNMSLLPPANALTRVLEWKDFGTPRRMSAPGPGEIKMAAEAAVGGVQNPTQLDVGPVKGGKPTVDRLSNATTPHVQPDTNHHSEAR